MKRAVIFSNGDLADVSRVKKMLKKTDFIIAANGGTRQVLKLGRLPDVVIGDLDSLDKKTKKKLERDKVAIISYPSDKDWTDTELGIKYAVKQGFKEIILTGFLGRRIDHLLANLLIMAGLIDKLDRLMIVEGKQEIYVIKNRLEIKGKRGDLVSLIPLLGDCQGVRTTGLKYKLRNERLSWGKSRGVSNVMLGRKARIDLKKGRLLVIKSLI